MYVVPLNYNASNLVLQCRACRSLLPPGAHLSPDVGPVFGVAGRMDFMLLRLKWGFELLTDGQAIKEHVDRQVRQQASDVTSRRKLMYPFVPLRTLLKADTACVILTAGFYLLASITSYQFRAPWKNMRYWT